MGTVRWKKYKIEKLLVPHIKPDLKDEIETLYDKYVSTSNSDILKEIDNCLYKYFDLNERDVEVVENA